jgi:hypothetical protein
MLLSIFGLGLIFIANINVVQAVEPDKPYIISATCSNEKVTILWSPDQNIGDGDLITGWVLLRGESAQTLVAYQTFGGSVTTYDDVNIVPGTTYYYEVQFTNNAEPEQLSPLSIFFLVVVPEKATTPVNLRGTANGEEIRLDWELPAGDGGSAILGYNVYRLDGIIWQKVGNQVTDIFFIDPGKESGTYSYKVAAVTTAWEGDMSSVVSVEVVIIPGFSYILVVLISSIGLIGLIIKKRINITSK